MPIPSLGFVILSLFWLVYGSYRLFYKKDINEGEKEEYQNFIKLAAYCVVILSACIVAWTLVAFIVNLFTG
jgi:hypothetical protein